MFKKPISILVALVLTLSIASAALAATGQRGNRTRGGGGLGGEVTAIDGTTFTIENRNGDAVSVYR